MSRSRHIAKQFKDWWGKRPLSGHSVSNKAGTNKFFKRVLHKIERKEWTKDADNSETNEEQMNMYIITQGEYQDTEVTIDLVSEEDFDAYVNAAYAVMKEKMENDLKRCEVKHVMEPMATYLEDGSFGVRMSFLEGATELYKSRLQERMFFEKRKVWAKNEPVGS